jgi:hypothetical protein
MPINAPNSATDFRNFFLEPASPKHRQYEALRAYFVESLPSDEVARRFGYDPVSFRVLCTHFRHDPARQFFLVSKPGPRQKPKKDVARETIIALRKQNYSVYDISVALKERGIADLSPTAVGEVLKEEGFAALPRRLDAERAGILRPTVEPVADVGAFSLAARSFATDCGGLFLFVPLLAQLDADGLAKSAQLPGSRKIPAGHALRSALALKLWSIERKSHVMAHVADEGLALFAGLNAIPKRSYLSEYSCQIRPDQIPRVLGAWHDRMASDRLHADCRSFNLDFHSVPHYGEDPQVEKHYVSMRSRSQPSILTFLAQDAAGQAFCYSNANIRKGEEADEIFRFISFWEKTYGERPRHLVFDSRLTTYANLAKLDEMEILFMTLRRRSPKLLKEIAELPPSAWRRIELEVPGRKYRHPRVYETKTKLEGREFRQIYVIDLGHEEPTILLTNDRDRKKATVTQLVTRYAQRMLIENALSDAVRFFHIDALSSSVGMKVDFDMALLVIASGLYRLLAQQMRGCEDSQARQIFRDLVDMPADVVIGEREVHVRFQRRAHLPILLASGLFDKPVRVPWWEGRTLVLTS